MLIYTLRRILLGLSVMFATLVITFLIFFMGPSDPAVALCPENKCKPEKLVEIRKSLGLDKPLVVQFSTLSAKLRLCSRNAFWNIVVQFS